MLNYKYPSHPTMFFFFFLNTLSEALGREPLKSSGVLLGPGNSRGRDAYHNVTDRQRNITAENYRWSRTSPPWRDGTNGTMPVLSALAVPHPSNS